MDVTCLDVRRELTTDPKTRDPEILQHLGRCNSCVDYLQEMKLFDNKLSSALKVEVPEGLESRILLAQRMGPQHIDHGQVANVSRTSNYKWMSIAAGIVLAIGLSVGMYKLGEFNSLNHQVLAHVYDELYVLEEDKNIQLASLNALLEQHGIQANEGIGYVRFAENCPFEDKVVPHFILDDQGKAVTVVYISWENIGKRVSFDDERFKGVMFGAGSGSFAILSEDQEIVDGMENRFMSLIETRI